ncbi:hypothetical protein [Neisseria animalis]|uniref:Lipoprotein n=1 Tax=Neisseria animalis TaxID=492 RepID=A0A5P3MRG7_NEIAN|nr:hypothetical protein [Neisseria animalis]QEY24128.1 hypothetical protein D0T90_06185 [Neisseria animalis]ROW31514.1 hypothetical protein CGZ60_09945 [Neisseria animalis]VEE06346.1 Uncharacterised protein [Neisseria animalis]
MNTLRLLLLSAAAATLAACAITPEQQARRAAAQKHYEQSLQIALAGQCDPETANLMRQQFALAEQSSAEATEAQQSFRLKYIDKINDPMFQACYKMAWQNHIAQQRLQEMRRYYDWEDFYYPFRRRPYGWW